MVKYWDILKVNTRHNILIHTAVAILLLCLSPLVLGVDNLPMEDTAKVLEMYVALLGIVLLTPVFLPEQNGDIRDLIRSKYTKITAVYSIRALESVAILGILLGLYMCLLYAKGCVMDFPRLFGGTFAEMLFMGGTGILCYALFDNLIAGYMIPVFYYVTALGSGSKFLKVFYPFSMSVGSYSEKYWLFSGGILMIILGICIRGRK